MGLKSIMRPEKQAPFLVQCFVQALTDGCRTDGRRTDGRTADGGRNVRCNASCKRSRPVAFLCQNRIARCSWTRCGCLACCCCSSLSGRPLRRRFGRRPFSRARRSGSGACLSLLLSIALVFWPVSATEVLLRSRPRAPAVWLQQFCATTSQAGRIRVWLSKFAFVTKKNGCRESTFVHIYVYIENGCRESTFVHIYTYIEIRLLDFNDNTYCFAMS